MVYLTIAVTFVICGIKLFTMLLLLLLLLMMMIIQHCAVFIIKY